MPNGGHYNRKTQLRKQASHPALARRLARGAAKLARKHARAMNRISLHHQPPSLGAFGSVAEPTRDLLSAESARHDHHTHATKPKEHAA